jgi:hypothetical protein
MHLRRPTALSSLCAPPPGDGFDALCFGDAPRSSLVCAIHQGLTLRERLLAPETEGAGAGGAGAPPTGGDKTFTQQDLDRIVQERVGKLNEKLKGQEAQLQRLAEIEKKLAESDEREAKAREEAELRGKTELEKLQIQIQKAQKAREEAEGGWQKKLSEVESLKTQAEQRFVDHVKRSAVAEALNGVGLAKGAGRAAVGTFLSEAQIELGDDHQIKSITVGGKAFDKPGEAAKHFLTENPYFAEAPPGGSGHPRGGNGAGYGNPMPGTIEGLLSLGLAAAGKSG